MLRLRSHFRFVKPNPCSHPTNLFSTLRNAGSMACLLKTRSVIRFSGPDSIKFLQGLVTNDVRPLGAPETEARNSLTPNMPVLWARPIYAAMLTPQGRFLYDLFLYRPPRPDEKLDRTGAGPGPKPEQLEIYADVDGSVLDELIATLKKYRLRSKVEIESVAEDFSCWQRFGGNLAEKPSSSEEPEAASVGYGGTVDNSGITASGGDISGWHWKKDPRLGCLGFRGIFPSDRAPPLVEEDEETDEENYLLWRLEKGIAEGSTEIPKGEAVPLEYNLAGLNAISFDKGCYVGQELVARTHNLGVIRKRLLPLRFLDENGEEMEQKVAPGSEVIDVTSGKKAGNVTTALGYRGLGLLRLKKAFRGTDTLTIQGQGNVKVETIKPKWWPSEWFQDHQQKTAAV